MRDILSKQHIARPKEQNVENRLKDYTGRKLLLVENNELNQEIATEILKARGFVIELAMTANAFEEDRQNAFDAGMNDHISKPLNLKSLAETLEKWLG